jgi:predicted DNA-binding transcriptional regulator AlpA
MPVSISKRLLNEKQAGAYLSVSRGTIKHWHEAGLIPRVPMNGRRIVRYDVNDLDAFVEKCKENNGFT